MMWYEVFVEMPVYLPPRFAEVESSQMKKEMLLLSPKATPHSLTLLRSSFATRKSAWLLKESVLMLLALNQRLTAKARSVVPSPKLNRFESGMVRWSSVLSKVRALPYFPVAFTTGHVVPEQVALFWYRDRSAACEMFSPKAVILSKFRNRMTES